MRPAAVPADPKFAWWTRLRDVESSWVSSRGESDRFLYYDGPTVRPAPLHVKLEGRRLAWRVHGEEFGREACYVDVAADGTPAARGSPPTRLPATARSIWTTPPTRRARSPPTTCSSG
jgi:hypothetical protein